MRCKIFSIILLITLFSGTALAVPKEDVKRGNSLYNKGDFEGAIKSYNEALAKSPGEGLPNFNSGAAQYKKSNYEKAIDSFNKAIA
nr:tetratricopeptide repeat protein [Candidatus Omnitrophota bacterium]